MNSIIKYVNEFIPQNYKIVLYDNKYNSLVNDFTIEEKSCHQMKINPPGLLIFDKPTNQLMAYITYSTDYTFKNEKYITIDMSCTGEKYRRKRLSTYLRMVIFLYAIQNDIKYIASDVNNESLKLLKKYGFKGEIGNYLEQFNWSYTAFVKTSNTKFKKEVNKFFKESSRLMKKQIRKKSTSTNKNKSRSKSRSRSKSKSINRRQSY